MTRLFRLLEMGSDSVDKLCKNHNNDNANKLEALTQLTQDELMMNAQKLLEKHPTDENKKAFDSIMSVYRNGVKRGRYRYR